MAKRISDAAQDVLDVVIFENWLRFYFMVERDGKLFISVPREAQDRIAGKYAGFQGLVDLVNEQEMDPQKSQAVVCQFATQHLNEKGYAGGMAAKVFDNRNFQAQAHLFHVWAQHHEAQLDQAMLEFEQWLEIFAEWKKSDQVKEYMEQLKDRTARTASQECKTVN